MTKPFIRTVESLLDNTISIPESGCNIWEGSHNSKGRPNIHFNGKTVEVHRLIWQLKNGPIPSGMCICHTCDVPSCINPDHLWLGTIADNTKDAHDKGRLKPPEPSGYLKGRKGDNHPASKLNASQVIIIRHKLSQGVTMGTLSREYGVTVPNIAAIKNRKTWTHI